MCLWNGWIALSLHMTPDHQSVLSIEPVVPVGEKALPP
jgi:hypothetical protein